MPRLVPGVVRGYRGIESPCEQLQPSTAGTAVPAILQMGNLSLT